MYLKQDTPLGGLRYVALQQLARGGTWRTEAMRSYPFPVLLWFTKSQGRLTINGVRYGYAANTLVIIPSHAMHGFECGRTTSGHALFLSNATSLSSFEEQAILRLPLMADQHELTDFLENIGQELDVQNTGYEQVCKSIIELMAIWVERKLEDVEPKGRSGAAYRLAASYSQLLEQDFNTGKTVAAYAEKLGITPTHLSRACRETCGRPASSLLLDQIFFEARKMLSETALPIKDIAAGLGFRSAAYFTRAFSQRVGSTPSEFRRTSMPRLN
ncbi:MAG: AraC family transcriptional regulator [Paracoccaceae bacterium]|nr:AraC family transcriptional regulator [Paracoccaceae bacterium]